MAMPLLYRLHLYFVDGVPGVFLCLWSFFTAQNLNYVHSPINSLLLSLLRLLPAATFS